MPEHAQSTENTILRLLLQGEMTGYRLWAVLRCTGSSLHADALYPLLHKMELQGLVRSRIRDISITQERRFYRLTQRGKARAPQNGAIPVPIPDQPPEPIPDAEFSMRIIRFRRWCSDAVIGIRVSPDREILARELYDHLYDCFCANMTMGIGAKEAEHRAIDAMGSARELSLALSRLHPAFWTKALQTTRIIIAVLALAVCFAYSIYFLDIHFLNPITEDFDSMAGPPVSGTHTRLESMPDGQRVSCDGYTLRVRQAELWLCEDTDTGGNPRQRTFLNLQLQCSNPLPWSEAPQMGGWIWAEDSLGNYYYCGQEDSLGAEPAVNTYRYRTGTSRYILDLWIYQFVSQDAQWIEFHYDRSGRDLVLRIDLTGGDGR